jgi:hypothetical protein
VNKRTPTITVPCPKTLLDAVDIAASRHMLSKSSYTRQALLAALARDGIVPLPANTPKAA